MRRIVPGEVAEGFKVMRRLTRLVRITCFKSKMNLAALKEHTAEPVFRDTELNIWSKPDITILLMFFSCARERKNVATASTIRFRQAATPPSTEARSARQSSTILSLNKLSCNLRERS
mmetsp:Transcript_39845/g.79311  ORF Transcript_39845/g.79311 Transcript_39845/m.79311 type:complete len:118 (+) Transcript_39845:726-1079(+)